MPLVDRLEDLLILVQPPLVLETLECHVCPERPPRRQVEQREDGDGVEVLPCVTAVNCAPRHHIESSEVRSNPLALSVLRTSVVLEGIRERFVRDHKHFAVLWHVPLKCG